MQSFNIRDLVSWTSQSAGYQKRKFGAIVEVVSIDVRPRFPKLDSSGFGRDHESYVVLVNTGKRKPSLKPYWPRVQVLEPRGHLSLEKG